MIVLDTHALVWWASGELAEHSATAAEAVEAERRAGEIIVSSMSTWELAMLVAHGRVVLAMDTALWLATVARIDSLRFVPADNAIALASVALPGAFHKDPAHRLIVATARQYAAPVVTADEKIRAYAHVRSIW